MDQAVITSHTIIKSNNPKTFVNPLYFPRKMELQLPHHQHLFGTFVIFLYLSM